MERRESARDLERYKKKGNQAFSNTVCVVRLVQICISEYNMFTSNFLNCETTFEVGILCEEN